MKHYHELECEEGTCLAKSVLLTRARKKVGWDPPLHVPICSAALTTAYPSRLFLRLGGARDTLLLQK